MHQLNMKRKFNLNKGYILLSSHSVLIMCTWTNYWVPVLKKVVHMWNHCPLNGNILFCFHWKFNLSLWVPFLQIRESRAVHTDCGENAATKI